VIKGGDPCIQVFIDATANQQIYPQGQRLATVTLDTVPLSDRSLVESLNLLLASAQFRARQDGIVDDKLEVGDNRTETLLKFLAAVKQVNRPLELQVVTAINTFTAGPLQINILALDQGNILFNTNDFSLPSGGR
jgi:uncharacterized protein (DUF3084 family)